MWKPRRQLGPITSFVLRGHKTIGAQEMTKRQICVTVDEKVYKKLKKEAELTGLPISRIVEMKLKGYEIRLR